MRCDNRPSENQAYEIVDKVREDVGISYYSTDPDQISTVYGTVDVITQEIKEGPLYKSCSEGKVCYNDLECKEGLFCSESTGKCERISCNNNPSEITSVGCKEMGCTGGGTAENTVSVGSCIKGGRDGLPDDFDEFYSTPTVQVCSEGADSCDESLECSTGQSCNCDKECASGYCDGGTCKDTTTCEVQPDGNCNGYLECEIENACDCDKECKGDSVCIDTDGDDTPDTCADKRGIEYNPPGCNKKLEVLDWGNGESWYDEADCEEECASGLTYRDEKNTCVLVCDGKVCSAACRTCDEGSCAIYSHPVITAADGNEEEGPVCECIKNCGGGDWWPLW